MAKLHRHIGKPQNLDWEGVQTKEYASTSAWGVEGKVIIGPHDGKPNYYLRYFRVEPGGYTSLDRHEHDHGVYIIHGRAEVLLGAETVVMGPHDVVYIPGNEEHQFRAVGPEPLGFLCIIPPH
jgi:quercetin dioxygenase-like cupin family protein